jgi:hypothetical protein
MWFAIQVAAITVVSSCRYATVVPSNSTVSRLLPYGLTLSSSVAACGNGSGPDRIIAIVLNIASFALRDQAFALR